MLKIIYLFGVVSICFGQTTNESHTNRYSEFDKPLAKLRSFWLGQEVAADLLEKMLDVSESLPDLAERLEATLETPEQYEEFSYVLEYLNTESLQLLVVSGVPFHFHPVMASTPEHWLWICPESFWELKDSHPQLFLSSLVFAGAFINSAENVPTSFSSSTTNAGNDFLSFTTGTNAQVIYLQKVLDYGSQSGNIPFFNWLVESKVENDLFEFFLFYGMNIKVIYPLAQNYLYLYNRTDALDPLAEQWEGYLSDVEVLLGRLESLPKGLNRLEALIAVNSVLQVMHHFMMTVVPRVWYQIPANRERHQVLLKKYADLRQVFLDQYEQELYEFLFRSHEWLFSQGENTPSNGLDRFRRR